MDVCMSMSHMTCTLSSRQGDRKSVTILGAEVLAMSGEAIGLFQFLGLFRLTRLFHILGLSC